MADHKAFPYQRLAAEHGHTTCRRSVQINYCQIRGYTKQLVKPLHMWLCWVRT